MSIAPFILNHRSSRTFHAGSDMRMKSGQPTHFSCTHGFLPKRFTLYQNYPNPFNPVTTIKYSLPRNCHIQLDIYNILGRKVRTLKSGVVEAGQHQAVWNGTDQSGCDVASGVYFYRLKAENYANTRKMLLLK